MCFHIYQWRSQELNRPVQVSHKILSIVSSLVTLMSSCNNIIVFKYCVITLNRLYGGELCGILAYTYLNHYRCRRVFSKRFQYLIAPCIPQLHKLQKRRFSWVLNRRKGSELQILVIFRLLPELIKPYSLLFISFWLVS